MKLQDFISKYNGKKIDWDGRYGAQCVDLFRQYVQELGLPQLNGVTGAADFWNDPNLAQHWVKIPNTPAGIPQAGDVMIWDKKLNGYGHIGIFISGDVNSFVSFDQNWPVGSLCAKVKHNYKYMLGWIRPIGSVGLTPEEKLKKIQEILNAT